MKIGTIANIAGYRINEQFPNLPICGAKFWDEGYNFEQ